MTRFLGAICLVFFATQTGLGQNMLKGIVTDQQNDPLPFVNILINDNGQNGVNSDIDGRFVIEEDSTINSITFIYLGYENLTLTAPFKQPLQVEMSNTAYHFEEVVVIAGENPAHRIIRKAMENRDKNDPEKLASYQCQTYSKIAMTFVPKEAELEAYYQQKDTMRKWVKKIYEKKKQLQKTFKQHDLMLIESVTDRLYKAPYNHRENVLHNRVSGFKKLPITSVATAAQPFSFHQENLLIFENTYLNPISKGSTNKYFFEIIDTLIQQQDSIFAIAYRPKKGKNFSGLKGIIHIHTNQYAIQSVIAEQADERLLKFRIEQKYQLVDGRKWFPEQLHFEVFWEKIGNLQLKYLVAGKTYISKVQINPLLEDKLFKKAEHFVFDAENSATPDSVWNKYRTEPLSKREAVTYAVLDSIGTKYKFDTWVKRAGGLAEGRFPIGALDILIKNSIALNNYEGARVGLGLMTSRDLFKRFEIGGYAGYGLGDKTWKYGGNIAWFFDKHRDTELRFIYKKDLKTPGGLDFGFNGNLAAQRYFSNQLYIRTFKGVRFNSYPLKYFRLGLGFSQQNYMPTDNYTFDGVQQGFNFTELNVKMRYAFNEKFIRFLGFRLKENSRFPIFSVNYTKGFDKVLGGKFDYSKVLTAVQHQFRTRQFGKTLYRIEAGWVNKPVPLFLLFNSPGFGKDFNILGGSNVFQTMELNEFTSDRFVHLFFRQEFGTLLLKHKKFQPAISLEHNITFGNLKNQEIHQNVPFKTLEKGYFEVGLVADNIIKLKVFNIYYLGLGFGVYYRYGPYQLDNFKDNMAMRLTIDISK